MKQLTVSQQLQVDSFTAQEKIAALKECRFPPKGFQSAGEFVSSMLQKADIEGDRLQLTPKQRAYLDLLFWQYRHQHNQIRSEQAKGQTPAQLDNNGIQQKLHSKELPKQD